MKSRAEGLNFKECFFDKLYKKFFGNRLDCSQRNGDKDNQFSSRCKNSTNFWIVFKFDTSICIFSWFFVFFGQINIVTLLPHGKALSESGVVKEGPQDIKLFYSTKPKFSMIKREKKKWNQPTKQTTIQIRLFSFYVRYKPF